MAHDRSAKDSQEEFPMQDLEFTSTQSSGTDLPGMIPSGGTEGTVMGENSAATLTSRTVGSLRRSSYTTRDKTRTIQINCPPNEKFLGNRICTAKYSPVSFFPAFLFEQFRRYSNIFFLSIALLQQIPDVSPTGRFTTLVPLLFILSVSALKEVIEDLKRHRADEETNKRTVEVLRKGQWENVKWMDVCVGDFVKVRNDSFFPADLILYSSSEPQALCYIETSNLDGETNLKVRQGHQATSGIVEAKDLAGLTGFLECELPNRNLYEFAGRLRLGASEDVSLGPDQVLLRGAKLQNTTWIFGQVVYAGQETKLMKNSTAAPLKRSTIDKKTNLQILILFILLIAISVFSAMCSQIFESSAVRWYLVPVPVGFLPFLYNVLTFVILYNNLIPISLTVTLEVVRFIQAQFINWDVNMYYKETKTFAMARTSNLNEELGQIRYVFSDKTGTLTQNIMEFKGCSIAGELYPPDEILDTNCRVIDNLTSGHSTAGDIKEFLVLLSVCHTVIPDHLEEEVIYHAASPDERALVYGARSLGYVFEARTPNHVVISALGVKEKYEILNVLEFTSTRKRMSVIVRTPDGKIKLYCKGADSVIYDRLATIQLGREDIRTITENHLEEFATQGLRTLCCAVTEITPKHYEEWRYTHHKAATAIQNRELKLEESSNLIENNLQLIGATAIEDKLQDKVPETIAALMKAGIHVWVLTGDKQETAINIGYSCQLLTQPVELLIINEESLDATRNRIQGFLSDLGLDNGQNDRKVCDAAVIVDGKTLKFALTCDLKRDFLKLCTSCRAVICCRASPIQKAEIVESVTQYTGEVTLAIGDGANDVAMIQKAHVGIGISGQEGLQAACASDYAIAQFCFLARLLFVHGAWNYDRMCRLIFYSYYKNICLYIIELWYAGYNGWSGQIIFERWTIGFYNMLFTCAQPIVMGVFEQSCCADYRLRFPALYKGEANSFSLKTFFVWLGNAILHSMVLYWGTSLIYDYGNVWPHPRDGGYLVLGNFIYTYVVIVVSLKSGLESRSWTAFTAISIFGSILLWFIFLMGYSSLCAVLPGYSIGSEICGGGWMLISSPIFWLSMPGIVFITLLPDFAYKRIQMTLYPTVVDKYHLCESRHGDPTKLVLEERHRLSETARLLRSARSVFSRRPIDDRAQEVELSHGYAFSQEEHGVVSQSDLIRTYDTTVPKPGGM